MALRRSDREADGETMSQAISLSSGSSSAGDIVLHHGSTETVYSTPEAAQAAAVSGDLIRVNKSKTVSATLGKDGVNWEVAPGVVLDQSASVPLFTLVSMSFSIGGYGIFLCSGGVNVFDIDSASTLRITAAKVGSPTAGGAFSNNGTLIADIQGDVDGGTNSAIYQPSSTAVSDLVANNLTGGSVSDNVIQIDDGVSRIRANKVYGVAGTLVTVSIGGTNSNVIFDLICAWITKDTGSTPSVQVVGNITAARITCPFIEGQIQLTTATTIDVRFFGSRIKPNKTNEDAIVVAVNGLTLHNCSIENNGTGKAFKQAASGGTTVNLVGSWSHTGAVDANVTLTQSNIPGTYKLAIYGAGTAYSLTNAQAAITMGTTSPSLTLDKRGTYRLKSRAVVNYNGATFAAVRNLTMKLRRTNNTAADVSNSSTTVQTEIVTTLSGTFMVIELADVYYTTNVVNDAIALFAGLDTAPTAGSLDVVESCITSELINAK